MPSWEQPTCSSARKGYTLMFSGMERGFRSLFCFKSALGRLEIPSPGSFVRACICAGSGRGAYGRSNSPLTVPLFWQAQACSSQSSSAQLQPFLHITSCAPCLLACSSLPERMSFVVLWLIGHCFNYCWTKQTWNFYLLFCCPSDHGLQAASSGLRLFSLGVNCSGSFGIPFIYTFFWGKDPSREEKTPLNSSFFALSQMPWAAPTGVRGKQALASGQQRCQSNSVAWGQSGSTSFPGVILHVASFLTFPSPTLTAFSPFAVSNSPQQCLGRVLELSNGSADMLSERSVHSHFCQ